MIKELKFFFYILVITLFLLFTLKYYFSDINKKNSYRSINNLDIKILNYLTNLPILKSDTLNIIETIEITNDVNKTKYRFWNLLKNND
tara:strand:+ start:117 stop:380 length:264 start_codon:yes stop_codon:yes gene_type:complete